MPDRIADVVYPKKPPKYWMAAKNKLGMNEAAIGRIWFRVYDEQRRYMAWQAADETEWQEHGLRKP